MSEIRLLEDEDSEDGERRVSLRKKELEVFVIRTVHQTFHQVIEQNIVPLISRIVKQEFELAGEKFLTNLRQHNSVGGIRSSESRSLQLEFIDKLSLPIYTNTPIKGEGPTPFRVALFDGTTNQVVNCGPESSAKVEIVVVKGDFDGDKRSNWTLEEFNNKIVREKEGRKSLLTGNVYLNLEEGIGFIGEVSFTHNARWMKVCECKLAAKVVDDLSGIRVREAITDSFVVKDFRVTYTEKHYPPSLHDEVYRLEKIGKNGPFHKSLIRENIKTVEDFLNRCITNPQSLRNILGTSMTTKMWEATVAHARTCILDNKRLHLYFPISSREKSGVVFNVVGQVMGSLSECCYIPIDKLSEAQKADANKLVVHALEHMDEVFSFDDEASMHSSLELLNFPYPSNLPRFDQSQPSTSSHPNVVSFDNEDSLMHLPVCDAAYLSDSSIWENPNNFGFYPSHFNDGYGQPSTSSLGISSFIPVGNENFNDPLVCFTESTSRPLHEGEHFQLFDTHHSFHYQNSDFESQGDLQGIVNGFLSSRAAKARRKWTLLFRVLRWWYSRRKTAALRLVPSEEIVAPKRARIY